MRVAISKAMWLAMSGNEFAQTRKHLLNYWNIDESDFRWGSSGREIGIRTTPHPVLEHLAQDFAKLKGARGHQVAIRTLHTWLGGQDTSGEKPAKDVQQFCMLLRGFFAKRDNQRVYIQDDEEWRAYYVAEVIYHKAEKHGDWRVPPKCELRLAYRLVGRVCVTSLYIHQDAACGHTPVDGLRACGLFLETEELRASYLEQYERFQYLADRVGYQCWARGTADDNLDGNPVRSGWWWKSNIIKLDPQGEASRVVIDVFSEEGREERGYGKRGSIDFGYWEKHRKELGLAARSTDADPADEDESAEAPAAEEDEVEERTPIEVPTYPQIAVFDLRRHLRLRVHVSQLEDYVYDVRLGSRLILPADVRDLLSVLLTQKSMFEDVIAGKGGGVVVLCAGPPGTGKTLTAEVYAEVMRRPLYAVQTAQLGTNAEALENELRRVFARAQRWGAILLLDEADVYVRARGDDLKQNAIVGVFLRVLEYYRGVMFMTTNRVDAVDDAIASRCIARIDYKIPLPADQKKIWRVLADTSEVELSDEEIDKIIETHSDLSGRDIKNLLKLARMIALSRKAPVDADLISFVKRFKPTGPQEEYDDREGGGLVMPRVRHSRRV